MTAFTVVQRPMESLVGFGTIAAGFAAWRLQKRKDSGFGTPDSG
jgi:hypothetical protein